MSTNLSYDVACKTGWTMIVDWRSNLGLWPPLRKANNKAPWDLPPILLSALQPKQRRKKHQQNDPILRDKSHQTHRDELAVS